MSTPFPIPNHRQARKAWAELMKYEIGLQPSNPLLQAHRDALHALSEAIDAADEWERLHPDHDAETQLERGEKQYRLKMAEKGLFTDEQIEDSTLKSLDESVV